MHQPSGDHSAASYCVETVPPLPVRPALSGIEGALIIVVILAGIALTVLGESTAMVVELLGGLAYVAARLVVTARAGSTQSVQSVQSLHRG
ncbi:hypothetical protein [Kitasatospora viridis]|uniref:Uncharacterized protein n=1 Tax=Kitasatospora viridis TaxID=281105 RepID=A0A561UD49_9ACTN|nr:hypothetical protein [Kitasatospora viridis]TWF97290.1 hypothetical protein FHX73_111070 [Kitasatospora viridis]